MQGLFHNSVIFLLIKTCITAYSPALDGSSKAVKISGVRVSARVSSYEARIRRRAALIFFIVIADLQPPYNGIGLTQVSGLREKVVKSSESLNTHHKGGYTLGRRYIPEHRSN